MIHNNVGFSYSKHLNCFMYILLHLKFSQALLTLSKLLKRIIQCCVAVVLRFCSSMLLWYCSAVLIWSFPAAVLLSFAAEVLWSCSAVEL